MEKDDCIPLMYQALAAPLGIAVATTDVQLAQQRFYAARRKANDPELGCLQFRTSPLKPEEEIWIVKGTPRGSKD